MALCAEEAEGGARAKSAVDFAIAPEVSQQRCPSKAALQPLPKLWGGTNPSKCPGQMQLQDWTGM